MATGIKITQHVFKKDDSDVTIADAYDLFEAFDKVCRDRGLCTGGAVRLVDDEGGVIAGGFRNGRGVPGVEPRQRPALVAHVPGTYKNDEPLVVNVAINERLKDDCTKGEKT